MSCKNKFTPYVSAYFLFIVALLGIFRYTLSQTEFIQPNNHTLESQSNRSNISSQHTHAFVPISPTSTTVNTFVYTNKSIENDYDYYKQWFGSSLIDYNFKHLKAADNVCNIPNLIFISHHKTGGYFKHWIYRFSYYCLIPRSGWIHDDNTTQWVFLKEEKSEALHKHLIQIKNGNRNNTECIVIMMVRRPIHNILSGYNFHASGREPNWTDAPLNNVTGHPWIMKLKHIPLITCFKDVWNHNINVIDPNTTTMYQEYRKGYINNYANKTELQYGLYLEFVRYVNCEWPLISSMYNETKNAKYFLFLRFEWFHYYNYTKSVKYMLNSIGVDDQNNYTQALMSDLQFKDLGNKHFKREKRHIMRGKYDIDEQIDLLLRYDTKVCLQIKYMTKALDGQWKYDQYC